MVRLTLVAFVVAVFGFLGGSAVAQDAGVSRGAEGVPFLWKVEGNGARGYLFGTVHLTDARVTRLSPVVEKAFGESEAFYAEIEATPEAEQAFLKVAMMEPGTNVRSLVGEETWARIVKRFEKAGLTGAQAQMLGAFEPWVFSALLGKLELLQDELSGKAPLDKALFQRAKKEGKTVGAIETVEEQAAAFEVFHLGEQVDMLRDSLDQLDEYERDGRDPLEELIAAWLSGNDAKLMALLDDGFGKDPELRRRAETSILWDRNRRMATRIDRKMKENAGKTSFFAIGALHLPDAPIPAKPEGATAEQAAEHARLAAEARSKHGVVKLLQRKGYRLTRIGKPVPAAPKPPVGAAGGGGR